MKKGVEDADSLKAQVKSLIVTRPRGTVIPAIAKECGFRNVIHLRKWLDGMYFVLHEEQATLLRAFLARERDIVVLAVAPKLPTPPRVYEGGAIHGCAPPRSSAKSPVPADSESLRLRLIALAAARPDAGIHTRAWEENGFIRVVSYQRWLSGEGRITEHHAQFLREWLSNEGG